MFENWEQAATFCEREFGVYVDWEERFFHCPECDDVVYECDWNGIDWSYCPICECTWEEGY